MSSRTRRALFACAVSLGTVTTAFLGGNGAGADPGAATAPRLGYTFPSSVIKASAAKGSTWRPEAATYGVTKTSDLAIKAADGTTLRADVYYPTKNGKKASGHFPVVLTLTPYGKAVLGAAPAGDQTGPSKFLVERGFIDVVADVRGTGDSEGEFGFFDPVQQSDAVRIINWAAKLPGSNGKVGMYGASYLGIDQLLAAAAMPKHSPLKAIFPIVPGSDLYQDTTTMGGLVDYEFAATYVALTGGLNSAGPVLEGLQNPPILPSLLTAEVQHLKDLGDFDATLTANVLTGGDKAYDGAYWHARSPASVLSKVVANGIPAYLVGGEYDLFQRGEPMNFAGLQNAWAGRPVLSPMLPKQKTTGRYQLIVGPFTHLSGSSANVDLLQLEWFDTWLKGEKTGMDRTPTPLHYYDLGTGKFTEHAHYPFSEAKPTRFYFSSKHSNSKALSLANHTLTTTKPTSSGADTLLWTGVSNPCGRPTDQWSIGVVSLATSYVTPDAPCVNDDLLGSLGLDRATYTTAPLTQAKTIAGPITASIYATATTAETEFVAQVEDVAPNGTATPLTEGALLGSHRAQVKAQTWRASDGQIIKPGHTYTKAAQTPVTRGALTRYDIEIFPTYATIAKGHRIRVTLATGDFPHLGPTIPALTQLLGGVYQVRMSPTAPSALELDLIPSP